MKYKLTRTHSDFYLSKHDVCILPTVRVAVNNMMYCEENFSIEFHFLNLHARLLWLRRAE